MIPGEYPTDTGWVRVEPDPYARGGWLVSVNGVPSSHIAEDPLQLEFEYMRWFATAIAWFVGANPAGERLSITHLGGGACTMARYLCAQYPDSRNTVVELDEKLTILARKFFNLPRAPHLKIRVGEARQVTDSFTDASRDVLIRDVFAGDTTPASLSTTEFFTNVHRSLRPGGLYIANCGDHRDLTLARSELKTMATVFRNVACIADPQMLKGRRYGNIVLLGTDSELPGQEAMHAITRSLLQGAVPAQFKDHDWCERFMAAGVLRFDAEHAT
ncbi:MULTISPECIES: spermidine synthase [unclassified Corynebacterium]|uniref:spermidine synthase n=1 Tax=unclassified Corynebacterium TaxID=2624378 RepID=UPI00279608E3|nr:MULTISPECIES: fused MFS/spermidine synthase [unclassified Corynebacterium]